MRIRKKMRPLAAMRTPEEIRKDFQEVMNLYDIGKLSLSEYCRRAARLSREADDYMKAYQREKGENP